MSIKKLGDIAEIISGYNFRTSIKETKNSSLFVLQSKNLSNDMVIGKLTPIEDEGFRTAALGKVGDVLLSSRGSYRASVLNVNERIIVASSVYIIRLKITDILPKFLAIYLNSSRGQSQLLQSTTGIVINSLSIKDLSTIEIIMPDVEVQKNMIKIYMNNTKLRTLLNQKSELIGQMSDIIINSFQ